MLETQRQGAIDRRFYAKKTVTERKGFQSLGGSSLKGVQSEVLLV